MRWRFWAPKPASTTISRWAAPPTKAQLHLQDAENYTLCALSAIARAMHDIDAVQTRIEGRSVREYLAAADASIRKAKEAQAGNPSAAQQVHFPQPDETDHTHRT